MKLPKPLRAIAAITLFAVFIPFIILSAAIRIILRKGGDHK